MTSSTVTEELDILQLGPGGPPRIWGFEILLVRVVIDGPHGQPFSAIFLAQQWGG